MFIYKIVNSINDKLYIGKTTEKDIYIRFIKHIKRSRYPGNSILYKAFKKYGIENFKILEIQKCETLEELSEMEKYWIKELNSLIPNGYNITTGGDGGDIYKHNPNRDEIIKKISLKLSGNNNPFFGKHHTEESKDKSRKTIGDSRKGEKNSMYNHKHTEESKEKMRANCSGGKPKGYCGVIYVLETPEGEIIEIKTHKNLMMFFHYSRLILLDKGEYKGYKLIKKIINKK